MPFGGSSGHGESNSSISVGLVGMGVASLEGSMGFFLLSLAPVWCCTGCLPFPVVGPW